MTVFFFFLVSDSSTYERLTVIGLKDYIMTNCCYIVFYFFMNLSNEINITINRNSTENITQIQAQNQQEIQIRRNISSNSSSISYNRYSMLVSSSAHLCHLFQTVVFWHRIFLHLKFDLRLFSPFLGNLFWHYLL